MNPTLPPHVFNRFAMREHDQAIRLIMALRGFHQREYQRPAREVHRLREGQAAIVRVRGDSMEPGLVDGDLIVVDRARRLPDAGGAVFVVRIDDAVMVKRVSRARAGLRVVSDNPAAPPVPDGPVEVIGRVVWLMREPR